MTSRTVGLAGGVLLAVIPLLCGCGGPSSHAQVTPTSSRSVAAKPAASTPSTIAPSGNLAVITQELDDAGNALRGADGAIGQTDPNAARAQEGSTP